MMNLTNEANTRVNTIESSITMDNAADVREHDTTSASPELPILHDQAQIAQRVNRKLDAALLPFLSLLYLCT